MTPVFTSSFRERSKRKMALGFMMVMDIPVSWPSSIGDLMVAASSNSF